MGLLPNVISSQKSLMNKSKSNYESLKKYMDKLTKYMGEIKEAWPGDAGEKAYIFKELNSAGKELAKICSGYKTYTVNVESLLDLLKDFLEFAGIKSTTSYKFNQVSVSKSTKTKVVMDTVNLRSYGKKLYTLGQKIEEIELDYKNIAAKIDDTVSNILNGKISSLSTLNRKLDKQALSIMKAGNAICVVCDKYELAEKNVAKKVLDITSGKTVTYGDGTPSNAKLPEKEGGYYNLPTMSNYNVKGEIGALANGDIKDKKEILEWIQVRNNGLPRKGEYPKGYCTKYTYDKLASIGIVLGNAGANKTVGNGNQWYERIKKKQVTWSSKYNCECVDGNNALETIIANNDGEPVYNIVISYKHAYRSNPNVPQEYDNCGHVMMVDAIINGVVYFSDNYYNKATSMSLSKFKEYYNSHYGNILGAAHFTSKQ